MTPIGSQLSLWVLWLNIYRFAERRLLPMSLPVALWLIYAAWAFLPPSLNTWQFTCVCIQLYSCSCITWSTSLEGRWRSILHMNVDATSKTSLRLPVLLCLLRSSAPFHGSSYSQRLFPPGAFRLVVFRALGCWEAKGDEVPATRSTVMSRQPDNVLLALYSRNGAYSLDVKES